MRAAMPRTVPLLSGFWEKSGALLWPQDRQGGGYGELIRASRWSLLFCFGFVFASGFGQTFFISLFQAQWQAEFDLSAAQMGTLYGLATLASGLFLPIGGRWLDFAAPARAGLLVLLGLACAAVVIAGSVSGWMLAIGLFALRFFGQGMSATLGSTYAARWFEHNRGRAISLSGLGYPASEAVMPFLATGAIALIGWRWAWGGVALGVVAIGIPLLFAGLARRDQRGEAGDEAEPSDKSNGGPERPAAHSVWLDRRFQLMIGVVAPLPFVGTGVIFFQATLAESRGWSVALFPLGFLLFALVRAFVSLSAGAWVDKVGAARLLVLPGLAFAVAIAALMHPSVWVIFAFFVMMGVSFGSSGAIMTSAFTEIFGKERIGTVRGASSSVAVFLTAAAPALFGWILAAGIAIESILGVCAVVLVVLPGACAFGLRRRLA